MANDSISNTPEWFKLTPAQKKSYTQRAFKEDVANGRNTLYNKANAATRANLENAYTRIVEEDAFNSEFNPDVIAGKANQEDADNSSAIFNWGRQIFDSHKDLVGRLDLFQQVMSDNPNTAATAEKYISKRRTQVQTQDTKELAAGLKVGFDTWKTEGFVNKLKGLAQIAGAVIDNPVGVMDVAAQSMSSMTSMGLGALGGSTAGGAAGSAVPIVGNAAGALWGGRAGALGAETVDAASAKFSEKLTERLEELKLTPTASNISTILADKEWFEDTKKKALVYGGSLSLADQATAGMITKFAELPMKAARTAARASLTEANHATIAAAAQATGKTIAKTTDDFVDSAASAALKAKSFKAKLGTAATHYVGEVASEPISEAIGTASIGDENTIDNLTMETLGGIGTGPFGVAINKSLYGTKLAKDKVAQVGKDTINSTPETKAAAVAHQAAMAEVKDLVEKPAEANYKAKIASIDHNSDEFIGLTDPTNKDTYNPRKAVDVLASVPEADPEILNKALDIADAYMDSLAPLEDKIATLAENENRTYAEEQEFKQAKELLSTKNELADSLYKTAETLHARIKGTVKPATINVDTDLTPDIIEKLGSHGTGNSKDHVTVDQLTSIATKPDITPEAKTYVEALKTAKETRAAVEAQPIKSTGEVSLDIYNGKRGSSFKGIDAYQQGINYFLSPKEGETSPRNIAKAKIELDGLKKFAARHSEKTAIYNDLFKTYQKGESFTPEQNQAIVAMTKENPNFRVAGGLLKVIPNMEREVKALNSEVKLAEMTYKRLTNQTNSTTSTPASSPSTEAVVKPTIAPVVPATPVIVKPVTETPVSNTNSNKPIPVVERSPATNPVVTSEPASDVTQTDALPTGQTRLTEIANELRQGQTTEAGLKELRGIYQAARKNNDKADHISKIQSLGELYKKAYHSNNNAATPKSEISNPSLVVAPVAASKPKDIQAPAPEEITAPQLSERRDNKALRKRWESMTEDERFNEAHTDKLTGLFNYTALKHMLKTSENKGKAIVSADMSGLKWANDNISHDAGDALLKAVATAILSNGLDGYRKGGDEFALVFDNTEEADRMLAKVNETLNSMEFVYTDKEGNTYEYSGFKLDYGTGENFAKADADLINKRAAAEARGERHTGRGVKPYGVVAKPATRGNTNTETEVVYDALEGIDTEVKINMGTEAEPNFMTKEEAIKEHELKIKEAEAVLKCTQA